MSMVGISSYVTSQFGLQGELATIQNLKMNTIRIASREAWLDPPDYAPNQYRFNPAYIRYILDNTPYKVIIDPNHVYYTKIDPLTGKRVFDVDGGSVWISDHWQQITDHLLSIASQFPNNDRVIIEVFNEYSLSDFWTKAQNMIMTLREVTSNQFLFNKWEQPWQKLYDPLDKCWYSMHIYFDHWTDKDTDGDGVIDSYGYDRALANLDIALLRGCKVCNTEVGAHSSGGAAITAPLVQSLNKFLQGCALKNIGNCLWNTTDAVDFGIYQSLGLVVPDVQNPTYVTLTIVASANCTTVPVAGAYPNYQLNTYADIIALPASGYELKDWLVNDVPQGSTSITLHLLMDDYKTVKPVFGLLAGTTYPLEIITNPNASLFPSPGIYDVPANSTQRITAQPKSGYMVKNWIIDGMTVAPNPTTPNEYSILMNGAHSVAVQIVAIPVDWTLPLLLTGGLALGSYFLLKK